MQTQFEFTLPRGYVDQDGNVHRRGIMRLATAMDEIEPLRDLRVRNNEAYLTIILLARVIVQLGELPTISTGVVENLFATDLAYLQAFYKRINEEGVTSLTVACSHCKQEINIDLTHLGESLATP